MIYKRYFNIFQIIEVLCYFKYFSKFIIIKIMSFTSYIKLINVFASFEALSCDLSLFLLPQERTFLTCFKVQNQYFLIKITILNLYLIEIHYLYKE